MATESTYDQQSLDTKIEKAYLSMLAETLSAARQQWNEPWLRSITSFTPQGFDGAKYTGMNGSSWPGRMPSWATRHPYM